MVNLTPKEKAKELFDSFDLYVKNNKPDYETYFDKQVAISISKHNAQQCALIAVDEILNIYSNNFIAGINYWKEVKQEINNI